MISLYVRSSRWKPLEGISSICIYEGVLYSPDRFFSDRFFLYNNSYSVVRLSGLTLFSRGSKSKFLKELEAKRLISKLTGIEVPILNGLPALNPLF